jgi:hypothetical protein
MARDEPLVRPAEVSRVLMDVDDRPKVGGPRRRRRLLRGRVAEQLIRRGRRLSMADDRRR